MYTRANATSLYAPSTAGSLYAPITATPSRPAATRTTTSHNKKVLKAEAKAQEATLKAQQAERKAQQVAAQEDAKMKEKIRRESMRQPMYPAPLY
ncbi:hypothetical protein AGDE_16047 [Angomonas deanei]|uniref:Uncharacterized protein n=1 Tax=Angomonas deanei TaxID=59799 RepID=A0A7G2CGR6_9TRYP|nr:hypothetical protein AGDE_16047 [Angomonas deanei]CAD2218161.1 hypothetical protein, conserved [Angomonas deanei]|eukprot:EPY17845.1 hypothetical protein AGDE_16047 [Angomonas deanei]